jgi:hypothetical protein
VEELSIDSDSLGTFSGEVERQGSMLDALRGKVRLARASTNNRFILASEGSFSSAEGFGLLVHGIEMLMVHDGETGAEVLEQHISYTTNYATATVRSLLDLNEFLRRISFASHAVVMYPEGLPLVGNVRKCITELAQAERIFQELAALSPAHGVVAMTDMRAHLNPTRMAAIGECCELLAKRLCTQCPRCGSGGFGLVATMPGLPCSGCGMATRRARGEVHACPFCGEKAERPRSDGATFASPSECEWCNP